MNFEENMLNTNKIYEQQILEKQRIAQEAYERLQAIKKAKKVAARRAKIKAIQKKIFKGIKAGFTKIIFKPLKTVVLSPKYTVDKIKKYKTKKRIAKENALKEEKARQERELERAKKLKESVLEGKKDIESRFVYDKIGKKEIIKQESINCVDESRWNSRFVGNKTTITTFLHTSIGPLEVCEEIKNGYDESVEVDYHSHIHELVKTEVIDKKSVAFKGYIQLVDENNLTQIVYVDYDNNVYTTDFENYQELDYKIITEMCKYVENKKEKAQLIKEDSGRCE